MTQKVQVESESSDDEPEVENGVNASDNPWMSQPKSEADIDAFLSGYRQYWADKNSKGGVSSGEGAPEQAEVSENSDVKQPHTNGHAEDSKVKALLQNAVVSYSEIPGDGFENSQKSSLSSPSKAVGALFPTPLSSVSPDESSSTSKHSGDVSTKVSSRKRKQTLKASRSEKDIKRKGKSAVISSGGKWIVTEIAEPKEQLPESLDDMFDDLNEKIAAKAKKKLSSLKGEVSPKLEKKNQSKKNSSKKRKAKNQDKSKLLEMKKQKIQIDLDEKLDEGNGASSTTATVNQLAENVKLVNSNTNVDQVLQCCHILQPLVSYPYCQV